MSVKLKNQKQERTSEELKRLRNELQGLCSTCEHAKVCIYARESKEPIMQCEEFFAGELPSDEFEFIRAPQSKTFYRADLKGICVNCENRDNCTFPKPDGGIWHCEEYK